MGWAALFLLCCTFGVAVAVVQDAGAVVAVVQDGMRAPPPPPSRTPAPAFAIVQNAGAAAAVQYSRARGYLVSNLDVQL